MSLYLLFESASGYAVFQAHGIDEIGQNIEAVRNSVLDLTRFGKVVKLLAFKPFSSALDALNQCNAVSEGEDTWKKIIWFVGERVSFDLALLYSFTVYGFPTITALSIRFYYCSCLYLFTFSINLFYIRTPSQEEFKGLLWLYSY